LAKQRWQHLPQKSLRWRTLSSQQAVESNRERFVSSVDFLVSAVVRSQLPEKGRLPIIASIHYNRGKVYMRAYSHIEITTGKRRRVGVPELKLAFLVLV